MRELPTRVGSVISWVEYEDRSVRNGWAVKEFGVAALHSDGWRLTNEIGPWTAEQLFSTLIKRDVTYFHEMVTKGQLDSMERRAKRANHEVKVRGEAMRQLMWRWIQVANVLRWPAQEGRKHNWLNENNARGWKDLLPPEEMWSPGRGWIPSEFERYILDKARARVALWLPLR